MLTVNSTINLAGQAVPNIIPAVQGDTGRVIVFTLADFTIPSGSTATYYVQKPSGEAVYNAATINDNKVTVELTAQSLAETGDNYGQVRILNGEDVVTSFDFILLVKPFRGIEAIESTTEMNIFDEAVQNAMEQFDSMLPDIIAPEFDSSTAYAAGDYVIYGGKLYQFTSAHSGAWTGADAEETTVSEDLGGLPFIDVESSESMTDTTKLYRYDGTLYYHDGTSWTEVGTGAGGGITIVTYASEMTNINAVYLYNGTEQGYTAGHWYYYNTGTSAWTDGGQYTGWETVDTALENFLEENAQEIGTLTVVVGSTTYTYNGSANVSITLPTYNGGVS